MKRINRLAVAIAPVAFALVAVAQQPATVLKVSAGDAVVVHLEVLDVYPQYRIEMQDGKDRYSTWPVNSGEMHSTRRGHLWFVVPPVYTRTLHGTPSSPQWTREYWRLDEVTLQSGGEGYLRPPVLQLVHDDGAKGGPGPIRLEVEADLAVGPITAVSVVGADSGYSAAPTVVFTDPHSLGSGAAATVRLAGEIESVAVTDGGVYDGASDVPAVTITGSSGSGSGAEATAQMEGWLTAFSMAETQTFPTPSTFPVWKVVGGRPEASAELDTLTLFAISWSTPPINTGGSVTSIAVDPAGTGYSDGTTVTIDPPGDQSYMEGKNCHETGGSGAACTATATATRDGDGVITGFTITYAGREYRSDAPPSVVITDSGSGSGAVAEVTVTYTMFELPEQNFTIAPGIVIGGFTEQPEIVLWNTGEDKILIGSDAFTVGWQKEVSAVDVNAAGSGYVLPVAVAITGQAIAGDDATATAELTNLKIDVELDDGGDGYSGDTTAAFDGGTFDGTPGQEPTLAVTVEVGTGRMTVSLPPNAVGKKYFSQALVEVLDTGLQVAGSDETVVVAAGEEVRDLDPDASSVRWLRLLHQEANGSWSNLGGWVAPTSVGSPGATFGSAKELRDSYYADDPDVVGDIDQGFVQVHEIGEGEAHWYSLPTAGNVLQLLDPEYLPDDPLSPAKWSNTRRVSLDGVDQSVWVQATLYPDLARNDRLYNEQDHAIRSFKSESHEDQWEIWDESDRCLAEARKTHRHNCHFTRYFLKVELEDHAVPGRYSLLAERLPDGYTEWPELEPEDSRDAIVDRIPALAHRLLPVGGGSIRGYLEVYSSSLDTSEYPYTGPSPKVKFYHDVDSYYVHFPDDGGEPFEMLVWTESHGDVPLIGSRLDIFDLDDVPPGGSEARADGGCWRSTA